MIKDNKRPITNTEYIENFTKDRQIRWMGKEDNSEGGEKVYAMFGMEQTECMRQLGYNGILPYMFAYWMSRGGKNN